MHIHHLTPNQLIKIMLAIAVLMLLLIFPVKTKATEGRHAVTQGAMLANSCAGCHGTDGKSPGSIPSITGKSAGFIEQALKGFRDGSRPSTVMGRHAKGYSDEEIKLIADFFSGSN